MDYQQIPLTSPLPYELAPPIPDLSQLPDALTNPPLPTKGSKSIFAFWNTGIKNMPPYLLRNVIAWYRRYQPLGWTIYVLDTVPDSPLHMSRFLDISSPLVAPQSLIDGSIDGNFAAQHTSDMVRFPLLLQYGGIYLDAGVLQFGDLNELWETHVANPNSPYDFAGFTMGNPPDGITIVNFVMMAQPDSPLLLRAHKMLLKLWHNKTDTLGFCKDPIVSHVPLMSVPSEVAVADSDGMAIDDEAMTDYAIQIQCLGAAQRWVDPSDGWNGPAYVRDKCFLYSMVDMAYVNEQMTQWNSQRQFDLFRMKMPAADEEESADQKLAREMVERCIGESWSLKLAHGFSAKLFGAPTLGMLWRGNPGTDCEEGTYAGWLRWAQLHCKQDELPKPLEGMVYEPTKVDVLDNYL